jgi:hypothetical protein
MISIVRKRKSTPAWGSRNVGKPDGLGRSIHRLDPTMSRPCRRAHLPGWLRQSGFPAWFVGGLLAVAAPCLPVHAQNSVTLAWNRSPDPLVAGYRVYYGGRTQVYTNIVDAGSATNRSVSGLTAGATYFFAVTCYNGVGLESDFSNEASYTVPASNPPARPLVRAFQRLANRTCTLSGTGAVNQTFVLLCTTNLAARTVWTPIATNTANIGSFSFTDTKATNYPQRYYRVEAR